MCAGVLADGGADAGADADAADAGAGAGAGPNAGTGTGAGADASADADADSAAMAAARAGVERPRGPPFVASPPHRGQHPRAGCVDLTLVAENRRDWHACSATGVARKLSATC